MHSEMRARAAPFYATTEGALWCCRAKFEGVEADHLIALPFVESGHGVHGERRKGSRASVADWNEEMIEAWEALVTRRNAIWNRKGRNFPVP